MLFIHSWGTGNSQNSISTHLFYLNELLIGLKEKKSILNFGKAICPVLILKQKE
jgi:hypothetical protein